MISGLSKCCCPVQHVSSSQVGVLCGEDVCTTTGIGCPCNANDTQSIPPNRTGFSSVTGLLYGSLGSVRNGTLYNNISSLLMGKLSPSLGNLAALRVGDACMCCIWC